VKHALALRFSIAALALCMASGATASDSAACLALREHRAPATIINLKHGIYWNGAPVTQSKFDAYLSEMRHYKTFRPIFNFAWTGADEAPLAKELEEKVLGAGFEIASGCAPIPF
jgi:hypothetical protein